MSDNQTGAGEPATNYEVGYKKPPQHTQFKKGQSGNPKGRPRGSKNLKTDLEEVLRERITVREGDRTRTVSKQRAIVIGVVNRTLKGDARAANQLLSMVFRLLDPGDGTDQDKVPLTDDELDILDAFADRLRNTQTTSDDADGREAA